MLLAALPLLLHMPELLHAIASDPGLLLNGPIAHVTYGLLPGQAGWLDPNTAWTEQSVGHLAAEQWLSGRVPWWNPYVGVGAPLAAGMQPAGLFMPFILLMHLSGGVVFMRIAMQSLAAVGAYGLLRRLGLHRAACLAGGVLYGYSGAMVWFSHGPDRVAAFLPWLLWGVERCRAGQGRMLAVALAGSLYAGFPETAYIDGLLALGWAALRFFQAGGQRWRFGLRVAGWGCVGLLLAAPAIGSFTQYLRVADVGNHGATGSWGALPPAGRSLLLLPYLFGPIDAYPLYAPKSLEVVWGTAGGFLGAAAVALALVGVFSRRETALRWGLTGWAVLAVAYACGVAPVAWLWGLVPMLRQAAFYRYMQPSLSMAVIVLAACALDYGLRGLIGGRARKLAIGVGAALLASSVAAAWPMLGMLDAHLHLRWFAVGSVGWAALLLVCLPLLVGRGAAGARLCLFGLIGTDAIGMAALTLASAPRAVTQDLRVAELLQTQPRLSRVLSIGRGIGYNEGALRGFAAINETMLPVPQSWSDYLHARFGVLGDPIAFPPPGFALQQIAARPDVWRELGVSTLVVDASDGPAHARGTASPRAAHTVAVLGAGKTLSGVFPAGFLERPEKTVGVEVGTFDGQSRGTLNLRVCTEAGCASGSAVLDTAANNAPLDIVLDHALVPSRADGSWTLSATGAVPVAIWMFAGSSAGGPRFSVRKAFPGFDPARIAVFGGQEIYRLAGAAPYWTAGGCRISDATRETLVADCAAPATLIRRELWFPGWRARVNGAARTPRAAGLFQAIDLPSGASRVRFGYAPPGAGVAWLAAAAGAAAVLEKPIFRRAWRRAFSRLPAA